MGREEIAVRLQQAFAKRWDVTLYKMGLPAVKDDRSNALGRGGRFFFQRSEEHTSELQSRLHLVCRLLLEKKKQYITPAHLSATYPSSCQPPTHARAPLCPQLVRPE